MSLIDIKQEVVVNRGNGGYGLSEEAAYALARRKNCTITNNGDMSCNVYTLVGPNQWSGVSADDVPRNDPDLVEVVRTLGKKANGPYARLEINTLEITASLHNDAGYEAVVVSHYAG